MIAFSALLFTYPASVLCIPTSSVISRSPSDLSLSDWRYGEENTGDREYMLNAASMAPSTASSFSFHPIASLEENLHETPLVDSMVDYCYEQSVKHYLPGLSSFLQSDYVIGLEDQKNIFGYQFISKIYGDFHLQTPSAKDDLAKVDQILLNFNKKDIAEQFITFFQAYNTLFGFSNRRRQPSEAFIFKKLKNDAAYFQAKGILNFVKSEFVSSGYLQDSSIKNFVDKLYDIFNFIEEKGLSLETSKIFPKLEKVNEILEKDEVIAVKFSHAYDVLMTPLSSNEIRDFQEMKQNLIDRAKIFGLKGISEFLSVKTPLITHDDNDYNFFLVMLNDLFDEIIDSNYDEDELKKAKKIDSRFLYWRKLDTATRMKAFKMAFELLAHE